MWIREVSVRSLVLLGWLSIAACGSPPAARAPAHAPSSPTTPTSEDASPAPPSGWSAKLADPETRAATITELRRLYEDTTVEARGKRDAPEVRALVDRIVLPLTHAYVAHYAELAPEQRVELIRLLGELDDPRIAPAVEKALDEFAKNPPVDRNQADVKWAARAVRDLRLSQASDALLRAFSKLRASTLLGGMTYRDVNEAMVTVPRASFTEPLIAVLAAKIVRPRGREDRAGIDAYRDQLFWQTTAAQVLGELRAERAIAPLMDVMLDPDKADIHATAVLALVKLGKRAVPRVTPLLAEDRSRAMAAIVLGTIGRSEAEAAMIAAARTANDGDRAIIARELTKLPATPASKVAFKAAFEKTPLALTVPPGLNGLTMLAEAAGQFYDPALVDWLIDRAAKARGQREDVAALRATIAVMIIKLARPDQLAKAKTAADRWGTQLERDLHQKASDLVQRCAKTASCYVGEMANPANQRPERQFVAIKAAYMAAIFGDAKTRAEILAQLDAFENAAVRFVAAQAIDHLSPRGSREAAAQIRVVIDRNAASGSPNSYLGDAPLRQVMYRLDTRAE